MRAKGHGADVVVLEVDPLRALEAVMDGFRVMPMAQAAPIGDIFVTATGDIDVVRCEHFEAMKDGAILANSGHFNVEINIHALEAHRRVRHRIRPFVDEFSLPDRRRIYLLGEGRLINLAAAEGHPASVMDMSFANQALSRIHGEKHMSSLQSAPTMFRKITRTSRSSSRVVGYPGSTRHSCAGEVPGKLGYGT